MNKIQKIPKPKSIHTLLENEKIEVAGKVSLGMKASFPGSVEGQGAVNVFFKLPTWLTLDVFRRIKEYVTTNHHIER